MRISITILFVALILVGCKSAQVNQTTSLSNKETRLKQSIFDQGYSFVAYNGNERWRLFFKPDSVFLWIAPTYKNQYEVTHLGNQFPNPTESYPLSGAPVKVIQMTDSVCVDTLVHESFPYKVTLKTDSLTLHGCGYNIYDTRINGKWRLTHIKGNLVPNVHTDKVPFIEIDGEREWLSGKASCNRISGKFKIRGNQLHADRFAMTRMACTDVIENLFVITFTDVKTYQANTNMLLITNALGATLQFERLK